MKTKAIQLHKYILLFAILLFSFSYSDSIQDKFVSQFWLTDPFQGIFFEKQVSGLSETNKESSIRSIEIDPEIEFQHMDGFGYTLTGGSARLINELDDSLKTVLLSELFSAEKGIGISYLRLSIGASDLSDSVFSYNDIPGDTIDPLQVRFNMNMEKVHLIPVLKEILAINPKIKLMGSPWSAPAWMKTNKSAKGGSLKKEYFNSYAIYLSKYILEMRNEGILIDAITVQNEPLHPGNNPSMFMSPEDQALFIKHSLGPIFDSLKIKSKIVIYDHNADRTDYPIKILTDTTARKFIDGSAFHLYGGKIEDVSKVHNAHPDKAIYFTEQWIGAPGNFAEDLKWHIDNLIIGAPKNWCKTVLEWNLAADANNNPHTDKGGCTRCLGAITIDNQKITRNPAYYIIAHASKFVRPGSVRIESNETNDLSNIAYKTPDDQIVVIVLNKSSEKQTFKIKIAGQYFKTVLNSGSVGTYVLNN